MRTSHLQDFEKKGYAVVEAGNRAPLENIRKLIYQQLIERTKTGSDHPDAALNTVHTMGMTGSEFNDFRLGMIRHVNEKIDAGQMIFEAFRAPLVCLLGEDILIQKGTNLTIQQPGDPDKSDPHRDAPPNSLYELVVWVPLVDCYGTKGMYVLDRENTQKAMQVLDGSRGSYDRFEHFCEESSDTLRVPFGHALIFWAGLVHGARINQEQETRWTINIRFKSLFSPNGLKEPFQFFKIMQLSPLTRMALENQKRQVLQ
ncbi:MAG: hypothetical protein SFY92_00995 [Verrucomicrobiae bacterium]|nr:hypothetical protein [Verrucomicrobiae bacterium]